MKNFLAVSLLLAPSALLAQTDHEIVKVNGTMIRQSEVLERLWKRHGPAMLEEMVDEVLMRQKASELKISATSVEIEKRVAILRAQFPDQATFEGQLKQTGNSLESLKRDLAAQLVQEKLLTKEKGLSVSESDLKKAFADNRAKLATPPSIHLRHMMLKSEDEARDLAAKIKAGTDFAALARDHSLAPTGKINGGDYGFIARGMLPAELDEIAFAMKSGELKVVPGKKGAHILQVLEKKPGAPAEFSKVKDDLRQMLLGQKMKAVLPEYLQELRSKADIEPQGSTL